ncbi:MAG TPA: hypothetical protein VNW49_02135, partial [Puia sp.]|nr:hypothetical protein [Puia sp.]
MNDLSRKKRHLPFEKFYAIFLISSIFVPISYLFSVSFIVEPGLSGLVGVFIYIYYFISGFFYWFSPKEKSCIRMVEISLLTQCIQIYVLGFAFINYYYAYIGVGFSDTPDWIFKIRASFFSARLTDYYIASNEISVYVNLITIGLYIYFVRKIK